MQQLNHFVLKSGPRVNANQVSLRVDSRADDGGLAWVLLLDDDHLASRGLARWMKYVVGLETRTARTIHQADCWLRSMPPPVAIISDFDLQLGETGAQALHHFYADGVGAPALVLTGAPTRARAALVELGLVDTPVLNKTGFHDELRAWLARHAGMQRYA